MKTYNQVNISYLDKSKLSHETVLGLFPDVPSSLSYENPSALENHILGLWLIAKRMGIREGYSYIKKKILTTSFGKPYIPSRPFFNIAHSHNLIVSAVTLHGQIGVDIEHKRKIDWKEYESSFIANEWNKISSAADPGLEVLNFWTKKESILKADGRGLQLDMSEIHLNDSEARIGNEARLWYVQPVTIPSYFCHVCTDFLPGTITVMEEKID